MHNASSLTAVPTGFGIPSKIRSAVSSEKGFSLAEMAIGLVILAIIVGVVIMAGMETVKNSKITSAAQQLESVQGAVISYLGNYSGYPTDLAGTASPSIVRFLPTAPDSSKYTYVCNAATGSYINYAASDATEANAIIAEWAKRLGPTGALLVGSATAHGIIAAGPVNCITN